MKIIKEFKEFALRGNMIEMAIGIIIGASFIEPLQPAMQKGFTFLEQAPDFIKYGILASIAASFGLRSISKFIGKK